MVALAVSSLVLGGDLGQAESTPVGEASNNTSGADDLGAGVTGNSNNWVSRYVGSGLVKIPLLKRTREPR